MFVTKKIIFFAAALTYLYAQIEMYSTFNISQFICN